MGHTSRKRYWIDRKLQGALAIRVSLHWLIFTCVAGALTLMFQFMCNPTASLSEHFATVWNDQGPFTLVMLLLLPVFLYDTVKLSNRFAGPVLRLRRAMTAINNGQPPERLTFRDNDFWKGMADDFNKLIDAGYFDSNQSKRELDDTLSETIELDVQEAVT